MDRIKNIKIAFDVVFIYILIDTILQVMDNYAYDYIVHAGGSYATLDGIKSPWFTCSIVLLIVLGIFSKLLKKYQQNNDKRYLTFAIAGLLLLTQGVLNFSDRFGMLNYMQHYLRVNVNSLSLMRYKVAYGRFAIKMGIGLALATVGIIKEFKCTPIKEE